LTPAPTTIIAYAGEEGRYQEVVAHARDVARDDSARLILYDVDAAGWFLSPQPTGLSAPGNEETFSAGVLTADQLRALGNQDLADSVDACAGEGIEAYGWLPSNVAVDTLLDYADRRGAEMLVVPAEHARHALADLLRGKKVEELDDETQRTVAVVSDDGTVELH
jgi:nucleotide-binding universal stress UspA family protein